jgi:hypothetical protein
MRRFSCEDCAADVGFEDDRCGVCATALGYLPTDGDVRAVREGEHGYSVDGDPGTWWRCLNHAWGCNWMVAGAGGAVWCVSCRLTRHRPDTAVPDAVTAWASAEAAKRRLVHQLLALRLPLDPTVPGESRLVFDLVDVGDGGGATGHREGVVTLDLREVDDTYREALRRRLAEPFRTVLGHLRHEVGHHYWHLLVPGAGALEEFRRVFGDERSDYAAALTVRYGAPHRPATPGYVTSYATAHPAEDWAETFAHYLHLRDGLETAVGLGIGPPVPPTGDVTALLDAWTWLVDAVTRIEEGLGQPPAYPIAFSAPVSRPPGRGDAGTGRRLDPVIVEKFSFVHRQVLAAGAGDRGP